MRTEFDHAPARRRENPDHDRAWQRRGVHARLPALVARLARPPYDGRAACRRAQRSRGSALVAAAGLFVLGAGSVAQQAPPRSGAGLGADAISAAQRTLGVEADGLVGSRTCSAVKRFQRSNGLTRTGSSARRP
jgi:peptidoglycan hydrolase-like protein with peptidoglycan-binding domain